MNSPNINEPGIISKPDTAGFIVVIYAVIVLLMNAALFFIKTHFSLDNVKSYEYIIFIGQIMGYAWIVIILANLFKVHYFILSAVISSDIFLKIITIYFPISPDLIFLIFWLTLIFCGRITIKNNQGQKGLAIVINFIFQLLILKENVFYLTEYDPLLYLGATVLMALAFYDASQRELNR